MMERHYRFAGVEIAVSMAEELFYTNEYQLAPFRVDRTEDPIRFYFEKVNTLDPPVGMCIVKDPGYLIYRHGSRQVRYIGTIRGSFEDAYIRVESCGGTYRVQVKSSPATGRIGMKTVLNALSAEHLIVSAGGCIFHSAYIDWMGKAILFTAPSETGKSTQAELWRTYRGAEIINGDRAALIQEDGRILAAGLPFAGSSSYCDNRTLPLGAVVYLKQAPVTTIRKLRGAEAFRCVWEGCFVNTWNREDMDAAAGLVESLLEQVSVYELACTPDESAVAALEGVLK